MGHIIVIGAGQAGASCCAKLRTLGYEGELTLIGAETVPPYQRPPLSKAYLLGEMEKERLYLRPESYYADQNITLKLGQAVTAINPADKTLNLSGETLSYDELVLTTGSDPRHLPASIGGELEGVYVVRDLSDVDAMAPEFTKDRHVLIVGGGYIGLEAAAVASKLGLKVTLLEMADRILQRVAAPETSDYFRELHISKGVDIREGLGLDRLLGDERVTGASLTDGSQIDVDFVIAGVGILPADHLASNAGIEIENGIKTNAFGQTSDPHIWAAGDCASYPAGGIQRRLESVQNAIDQSELVAENILGAGKSYDPKPWFWSDQYDVKLQIAGLNIGFDKVVTRAGDKDGAVSHWYYDGDKLLAVDAMNDPRAYMVGKRLIEAGKSPSSEAIASPKTDLKELLKA
jgi:3-phenylpropionate/trans-cinnamate dioxygenase ferredoxin reductase subunit